jgi:predicted molibdopterin-dependent oxidoreductase YjgC
VTDAVRPGEVFIPFVRLGASAANFLTNAAFDPDSDMPEYKVCAVRLEKLEGAARVPGNGAAGAEGSGRPGTVATGHQTDTVP